MIDGRLHQKSLRTRDKKEAAKREHAFVTDVTRGEFDLSKTKVPMFYQFEKRVFDALRLKVKPRTLEFYQTSFKHLATFVPLGSAQLDKIDAAVIEEFVQFRSKEVSVATVNHALRTLRRVLRLAEEWKIIRRAPRVKLLTGERTREYVITDHALTKMLAHPRCTEMLRAMLPFLIDTGLRISEATSLLWDDIDTKKKTLFIRQGKTKNAVRYVPMTDRVTALLSTMDHNDPRVFSSTSSWVSHQFTRLRDAMKLPSDCVIHSTRHTFLTRLGATGCDAFTMMRLAGHSNVTMLLKYVHPHELPPGFSPGK